MKRCLQAWAMCRSMFCAIPTPWRIWNEDARPLMLSFLPVLGLELGFIWYGLAWFLNLVHMPVSIAAFVLSVYPYAVSGAIHLDGFMDVVDATRSCADRDKRLEILKDPHVGSFAVIGCFVLLLAGYSVFAAGPGDIRLLILIPVVSRCCSALSVMLLQPISVSQYAGQNILQSRAVFPAAVLVITLVAGILICGYRGTALIIELAGYAIALLRSYRSLGGINGDAAGYCLTIAELCGIASCVLL